MDNLVAGAEKTNIWGGDELLPVQVTSIGAAVESAADADKTKLAALRAHVPNFDDISAVLKTKKQWVCWGSKRRLNRAATTKDALDVAKVPINTWNGGKASSTDPNTWATFEEAKEFVESGKALGVGFVFNGEVGADGLSIVGVDLDSCIAGSDIGPAALDIIKQAGSYCEVSPSGKGVHIIGRAQRLESGAAGHIDGQKVEIYSQGRYFTMSGAVCSGYEAIRSAAVPIAELAERIAPGRSAKPARLPFELPEAFRKVPDYLKSDRIDKFLEMGISVPVDPIKFKSALEAIPLEVLAAEDYFFDIYTATANETHKYPEQKEELYIILDARFAQAANYERGDNRARFERFFKEAASYTGKPLGIGSIYKLAGEHGWKETPIPAPSTTGEVPETDDYFDNFPIPKSFDAKTMVPRGFGVFDDIYEHILASSILPQPVYAVGAAIVTASAIIGNRFNIEDSGGLRLNLYGCLIGGTTSNKTDPIKAAVRIVKKCERKYFASATGTAAVQDKVFANAGGVGGVVQLLDEAAPIFSTMSSKNKNPYAIGLLETYLDLFSKSNGFYVERAFARDRQAKPGVTAARVAKIISSMTPANLTQPASPLAAGITPPTVNPAVMAAIQAAMTAASNRTREIDSPFLSACWVSTPTLLGAAMEIDMASAGLLNRILTFVADNDDPEGRKGAFKIPDVPATIVNWAKDLENATRPVPTATDIVAGVTKTWGCQKIALTGEVQGILDDRKIRNAMLKWANAQRSTETAKEVVARATELTLKVAGILAVCKDMKAPVIDVVALGRAVQVVGWCLQRLFGFAERNIADSPDEKIVNRIRVFLENAVIQDVALSRADRGWVSRSALLRKSKLLARRLDEILGTMVDAGDLARRELIGDGAQKPTTQYRRSGRTH